MVAALFQSILHKEHGFIRGLYLKKIQVKNWVGMGNQSPLKELSLQRQT